MKKVQLKVDSSELDASGTTDRKQVNLEDRTLRGCCQNAMALSVAMLADPGNRRIACMISRIMEPLIEWHAEQNRSLRSSGGTFAWMQAQFLEGGFASHITKIVGRLEDKVLPLDADFVSDRDAMRAIPMEDIGLDDELAERCGICASTSSHRVAGGAWLGGGVGLGG